MNDKESHELIEAIWRYIRVHPEQQFDSTAGGLWVPLTTTDRWATTDGTADLQIQPFWSGTDAGAIPADQQITWRTNADGTLDFRRRQ